MKPESAIVPAPTGAYRALLERTAGVTGQDFFRELVRVLTTVLDVEYAFVTTQKPQDATRLLLVAAWHVNHAVAGGGELLLQDTPSARVLQRGQFWQEDGVAADFPKDRWLRKHGVRAYCAVAIPGLDGQPLGHLGIMSRQAFLASDELFGALQILAVRAAAELRRRRLDELQRLAANKFATAFRAAPAIIGISELDTGKFTDINQAVETMLGYSPAEILGHTALELGIWEFPAEREEILTELRLGGKIQQREIHLLTRKGEHRRGLLSAEVVEFDRQRYVLSTIQDMTEFRAALETLHERELTYRALFNIGANLVFLYRIDAEGRAASPFLEVNDVACRALDYTRDELLNMAPPLLSEARAWRNSGQKLLNGDTTNFEAPLRRKNGRTLPMEFHACLLSHDDQRTVIAVGRDISQGKLQAEALHDAEEKYRSIFENAIEGIYQTTPDGRILSANPALARILGYGSVTELVTSGVNIAARIYLNPGQRDELLRHIEHDGYYSDQEYQLLRHDGTPIWVCDNARVVRGMNSKVMYYEGTLQDITPRKRAEEALIQSEEKYRTLVDLSQDGMFISQEGRYVYANRAYAAMLGYKPDKLPGVPVTGTVDTESAALAMQVSTDSVGTDGPFSQEMRLLNREGGRRFTASVTLGHITWRGRPATTGTVRDITEQKKSQQELAHSASHDTLTGLPNRNHFMRQLAELLKTTPSGRRMAVLFLDLDRFKLINDSLGHGFGDRLLGAIAKRLRTCVRPGDLIARYGGDEFTILLQGIQGLDDATAVADRIHEELARAFNVDGHEVFSTASIGIVLSAPHYQHPDEVLRDADTAMYRAKAAGKAGYVVFDDAMHQHVKANLKLETELRHALQRNEFRIHYQPVLDLASGRLTGFEALVRWEHPERGLVGPEQFLPVAEETGLIIPLGWWVLETACTQFAEWKKRHRHLPENITISVNIANRQFAHWVLPQRVARVLDLTGIPARSLCLEITETVFMDNPELAAETIGRLRNIGVNLQMDDFGTGYSSLSALRNFKLDTLKIDRSFVTGIERNRSDRAIVRTITVLAADLGMDVVAEGIENSRQLELLRALGCRKGQGYYFSKPFAASTVDRYLAALTPPKS